MIEPNWKVYGDDFAQGLIKPGYEDEEDEEGDCEWGYDGCENCGEVCHYESKRFSGRVESRNRLRKGEKI